MELFTYLNIDCQYYLYKYLKKYSSIPNNLIIYCKNYFKNSHKLINAILYRNLQLLDFYCKHYYNKDDIIKYLLIFAEEKFVVEIAKKYNLNMSERLYKFMSISSIVAIEDRRLARKYFRKQFIKTIS